MTPEELDRAIKSFVQDLSQSLPEINQKVAINAYAMIRNRIVNTGKNAKGESLGNYSETEVPAFFFKGKSLNQGGERAVEKAEKTTGYMSYEEFRKANNRPTNHITLSFSGDTWRDIGVLGTKMDSGLVVTTIGPLNQKSRKSGNKTISTETITDGLYNRFGDFLQISVQEDDELGKTIDAEVQKIIDKYFNA